MNAASDNTTDLALVEVPPMTPETFAEMVARPEHGGPVVTLMIPMQRKGKETRQNPIRFKNALGEARQRLEESGREDDELARRLDALSALDDPTAEIWQQQDRGLAVVIDRDRVRAWKLPAAPADRVHVADRPALGGLLRLHGGERTRFLVLDLDETRLLEVSHGQLKAIGLGNAPTSLDEAMRFDDPEKSLQFRAAPAPSKGPAGNAMYHGHGVSSDDNRKRKIRRFFEMVDAELSPRLAGDEVPLVLFGPAMECGIYREVNSLAGLAEDEIHFNPSELDEEGLEERLMAEVAEKTSQSRSERLEELEHAIGVGQGDTELGNLLAATVEAKLATLLVDGRDGNSANAWGSFDPRTGKSVIHESRQPGDQDLLETLATAASLQGAGVVFLSGDDPALPGKAVAAGLYRY